jgi:hypothetical protein
MSPPTAPLTDNERIVILPPVAGLFPAMVLSVARPSRLNQRKSAFSMTLDWPTGWRACRRFQPERRPSYQRSSRKARCAGRLRSPIGHLSHARSIRPRHGKAPRPQVGTDRQAVAGIRGGAIPPLGPRAQSLRPHQLCDPLAPTALATFSQLDLHTRTAIAAVVLGVERGNRHGPHLILPAPCATGLWHQT